MHRIRVRRRKLGSGAHWARRRVASGDGGSDGEGRIRVFRSRSSCRWAASGRLSLAHGAHVVGGARAAFRSPHVKALRVFGEKWPELGARHPRARVRAEPEKQRARCRAHVHAGARCLASAALGAARVCSHRRRRIASSRRQTLVRVAVALLDLSDSSWPPGISEHCTCTESENPCESTERCDN